MISVELTILSLRRAKQSLISLSNYQLAMIAKLDDLDEVRLLAQDHFVVKKKMVERACNKKIRPKSFKVGDLVWEIILLIGHKDHFFGKWPLNWKSPFIISKVLLEDAYHLANKDGELHERSVNGKYMKIYKPCAWDAI